MTGNMYQVLASRTNDGKASARLQDSLNYYEERFELDIGGIINACVGLSGEVGELNDIVKKWIFHQKELNEVHLKKELGDVMWYVAMLCESMGWNLDDVLQMNVDKLKARYPDGFDIERANNRQEGDV
jgi:NTP pyrophosphatase (non-canonical NTP hydrolase)